MMVGILFVIGILLLVKGADYFVDGASGLAKKLGVPAIIIGLTIIAFGTSAPELFVNIQSALNGHTELAIGNVLGSNIANILLICGVGAVLGAMTLDKIVHQNITISLLFAIVLGLIATVAVDNITGIGLFGGIILIVLMAIYLYYMFRTSRVQIIQKIDPPLVHKNIYLLVIMIVGGLIALLIGSNMIVTNAVIMARKLGISERVIGLTIIALGTSLPELVTTIISIRKGQTDIGLGNIIGSNIFNIGLIAGLTAMIHPIVFSQGTYFDIYVLLGSTILIILYIFFNKKYVIKSWQGRTLIAMYVVYLIASIVRN